MLNSTISDNNHKIASMEILDLIKTDPNITQKNIDAIIRKICKKYSLNNMPSKTYLLSLIQDDEFKFLQSKLKVQPTRTASGIAIVGVFPKPDPCPHGTCTYCPGGVRFNTPQSYVLKEPGINTAIKLNYDSYKQVISRIELIKSSGHDVNKAELIVVGGTFLSYPKKYQIDFVKKCFDALNGAQSSTIAQAHKIGETAKIRNVGLTVETKPDWCKKKDINLMLSYGTTRVEIGVQNLNEESYNLVNRGHDLNDVIESFRLAKDSGLKIVAHMMPGLPGTDPDRDLQDFNDLLHNNDFKPDMLKIYPTLVLESTPLYNLYKLGKYKPYDLETTLDIITKVKKMMPNWVRVMRVQRAIGSDQIIAGVKDGNLRELALNRLKEMKHQCNCIRCREIGLSQLKKKINLQDGDIKLYKEVYPASNGLEIFLSYECKPKNLLIGFTRIRLPSKQIYRKEITSKSALIRELHVYGNLIPIGDKEKYGWQHKGYGSKLMVHAEKLISETYDKNKLIVISAVGTREYYKNLGYKLEGPYMTKTVK